MNRILLPRPSPDEIDACDISPSGTCLRMASNIIEKRELVTIEPAVHSTSKGRLKRPDIVPDKAR